MAVVRTALSLPAPTRATRTVRLTRRGRAFVLLSLIALLLAAFSLGRQGSSAATHLTAQSVLQQTTVETGETLWSLARRVAPDNDPREVVQQIRQINHLQGSNLRAGQQLLLPRAT